MLILAVDTSSRQCSLAVLRDDEVLGVTGGMSEEPYASRLFSDLDWVLTQANVEVAQIELFAVATGPGAFTGLRVGLAAVKGWSEVFSRPVAAVSVLEAIAAQARPTGQLIAPVADARGGQFYGGLYRRDPSDGCLHAIAEEVVLSSEEYFRWISQVAGSAEPLFVTTTPEPVKAGLAASPFAAASLEEVSGHLAPFIGRLGLQRSQQGKLVDALALEANYVRRSDAEVKWRGA